ncbi:MAG: hypothetical protein LBE75_03955 [Burkholderiales bacterium]|jgi:YD repeat-containing protein|nr:hypothetical protein [Burkholderiales bacterium]
MNLKTMLFLLLVFFLAACGGGGSGNNNNGGSGDNGGGGNGGGGNGDDGDRVTVKKLLSRVMVNGLEQESLQYDNLNRLVELNFPDVGIRKFEYEGNDPRPSLLVDPSPGLAYMYSRYQYGVENIDGVPTNYFQTQSLNANGVPFSMIWRYYLNDQNRIIAAGTFVGGVFSPLPLSYLYDDHGNLIKETAGNDATWEYTYDNKKSPVSEAAAPRWLFDDLSSANLFASPNNPLTETYTLYPSRIHKAFRYTYDSDGYPTEVTVTSEAFNDAVGARIPLGTVVKTFEYILAH